MGTVGNRKEQMDGVGTEMQLGRGDADARDPHWDRSGEPRLGLLMDPQGGGESASGKVGQRTVPSSNHEGKESIQEPQSSFKRRSTHGLEIPEGRARE